MFDPSTAFHTKNIAEERPSRFSELPDTYAAPTAESDSTAWSGRPGSPEPLRLQQHIWLAHFVNDFGRQHGFELLCRVLVVDLRCQLLPHRQLLHRAISHTHLQMACQMHICPD